MIFSSGNFNTFHCFWRSHKVLVTSLLLVWLQVKENKNKLRFISQIFYIYLLFQFDQNIPLYCRIYVITDNCLCSSWQVGFIQLNSISTATKLNGTTAKHFLILNILSSYEIDITDITDYLIMETWHKRLYKDDPDLFRYRCIVQSDKVQVKTNYFLTKFN